MRVGKHGWMQKERDDAKAAEEDKFAQLLAKVTRDAAGEAQLSSTLVELFALLLVEGNTRSNVTKIVGLQRTTLSRWLQKGKRDIEREEMTLEAQLVWTIDRCEGEQERRLVRAAFKQATSALSDGTLALKILERRAPADWAPALPEGGEAVGQYVGMSVAALKEEAKRVLQAAAKQSDEQVGEVVAAVPDGVLESGQG